MCVVPALFTCQRDTVITFLLSYVRKEDFVYPLWFISKLHNIKKKYFSCLWSNSKWFFFFISHKKIWVKSSQRFCVGFHAVVRCL